MKYITITTPNNLELEYRLAGIGSRLAAFVIDMVIQAIIFVITGIALFYFVFMDRGVPINNFDNVVVFIAAIFYFIVFFGYFIISEMLTNGQSIGKKVFGLRVIRENGMPVGFIHSLIRNLFRYFIDALGIGVVSIALSKKCKRIGDFVASTVVVSENPMKFTTETFKPKNLGFEAAEILGFETFEISEQEYYLLDEYFKRRTSFTDGGKSVLETLIRYFSSKNKISSQTLTEDDLYKMYHMY